MSQLVDDLLVYARRGAPAPELDRVDVGAVVAESEAEFRAPALARGLRLQVHVEPGLDVVADRVSLRRALANLLSNAVRLAPEGSTISVDAGRADGRVRVAVGDEGPGIAPEDRGHVFERFWRGREASAREDGRSGLGLAIVAQIAADSGGSVVLTESPAGGSIFTLDLPAV